MPRGRSEHWSWNKRFLSDYIRYDLALQFMLFIFKRKLFLFHPLDAQGVTSRCYHRINGNIKIFMVLLQPCQCQSDFGLILIGHKVPRLQSVDMQQRLSFRRFQNPALKIKELLGCCAKPLAQIIALENATTRKSTDRLIHVTLSLFFHKTAFLQFMSP